MDAFELARVIFLATISFVIAMAWTPALTHILYRYKLGKQIRASADAPVMSALHAKKSGTPTMGGVLIWVTVLFVCAGLWLVHVWWPDSFLGRLSFLTRAQTLLPLGVLLGSALVGLVDDWMNIRRKGPKGGGMSMKWRLGIYTAIAAVGAWWFVTKLGWDTVHIPFMGDMVLGAWAWVFYLFVIVATAFSVNETDGLDGLAGGVLMTCFFAFGAIAFFQGRFDLAAFCAVIIGALLAFLWFNINPARFFMGDTGAMALGVTLGIVALLTHAALWLPLIGLVLVVESVSVLIQQGWKRILHRKLFLSTPIHHHFEAIGWPEPKIVMRAWVISIVTAVLGVALALLDKT